MLALKYSNYDLLKWSIAMKCQMLYRYTSAGK